MIENNIISDHFTVEELKKLKITPPDVKMYKKNPFKLGFGGKAARRHG